MRSDFDYFVIYAEMRTGSNFLQENINAMPGLHCWGEAFNPHFVGKAGRDMMCGVTKSEREANPARLVEAMRKETAGLAGFRYFHDHDPRVLELTLANTRCAKVVLTRNPLDSYVSLKIARATNQWRLSDMKNAKSARITFLAAEFRTHVDALQRFQVHLMRRLQTSGQTAFYVAYEDIQDVEVLNGLGRFLGAADPLEKLAQTTKVQNPAGLEEKVENYAEMVAALSSTDFFGLGRTPNFEPRRGPGVPGYVTARDAPLLFMPVAGGPEGRVRRWMAELDGVTVDDLPTGQTQKELRRWLRLHNSHRSFTAVRHPVDRLHDAFCRRILPVAGEAMVTLRETLRQDYRLPIPEKGPDAGWTPTQHRAAFLAFAAFVKGNLGGQTSLRVEKAWASQNVLIQGMADFAPPELIFREDDLADGLDFLAARIGRKGPKLAKRIPRGPVDLSGIYDAEIEAAVREIYQRDYLVYGFAPWGAKT